MNWVDITIIVVVVILGFIGLKQGLVRTVFSFAGIVFGILVAGQYDRTLSDRLFPTSEWGQIVSFAILLVGILIAANIVGAMLKKVLRFIMLGWLDTILGGVFGLVAGAALLGAVLAIIVKAGPIPIPGSGGIKDAIRESSLAKLLVEQFPVALSFLPGDVGDKVRLFFKK